MRSDAESKSEIVFLVGKKQYQEALRLLEIYLENHPYDYYMVSYKISILYRLNRKSEAESLANEVLESDIIEDAAKKHILETLAVSEHDEKNYLQAITYWKECNALYAPKIYIRGTCNLSLSYLKLGQTEEAMATVAPRPDFNPLSFNVARARIYYGLKDYSKALEELEVETTSVTPEVDNVALADKYNLQGLIYEKIAKNKDYRESKELYQKALELQEKARRMLSKEKVTYWDATKEIAVISYALGNEDVGKRMCNEILDECRNKRIRCAIISLIANNNIKNVRFEEAEKIYDQYGDESLRRVLGYAKVSMARYDFKNVDKLLSGISTIDKDIMYSKNYIMAQLMFRKNDYEGFLKYYSAIIISDDSDKNNSITSDIRKMLLMLQTTNNIPITNYVRSYYEKQIVSYDEEAAIANNIEYRIQFDEKESFNPNTDIRKLYSDVKDYLHKDRCLCDGVYDKYIVDMSEIGEIKDNLRFVTVVCLANTKNIVKIYPSNQYVGIFVEPTSVQPVQKTRLTAMEKFNKKYGL